MDYLIVYRSGTDGLWRWRYCAANNKIIATAAEGYDRAPTMLHVLARVVSADLPPLNAWERVEGAHGIPLARDVRRIDLHPPE